MSVGLPWVGWGMRNGGRLGVTQKGSLFSFLFLLSLFSKLILFLKTRVHTNIHTLTHTHRHTHSSVLLSSLSHGSHLSPLYPCRQSLKHRTLVSQILHRYAIHTSHFLRLHPPFTNRRSATPPLPHEHFL